MLHVGHWVLNTWNPWKNWPSSNDGRLGNKIDIPTAASEDELRNALGCAEGGRSRIRMKLPSGLLTNEMEVSRNLWFVMHAQSLKIFKPRYWIQNFFGQSLSWEDNISFFSESRQWYFICLYTFLRGIDKLDILPIPMPGFLATWPTAVMCAATTGKWRGLVWDKLLQLLHILTSEVLQDWRVVFFGCHFDKGEEGRQQRSTCGALHGECGEAWPWLHLSMGTCLTV